VQESLSAFYAVKAAAVFGTIAAIAASRRRAHHPFARFGPANQMTTVRALLVSLAAGFIGEARLPAIATAAATVGGAATALDGVDGWLARRTGLASAFGARFDMETDALLIQVLSVLAWQHGKAGAWVLACGLMRYVFVACGRMWPWLQRPLFPSIRRKAICVVQLAGLIIALLPWIEPPLSAWIAAVSLAALAYSFLADCFWLWQRREAA
jgi:phosphatidylglycerophosphate synthase